MKKILVTGAKGMLAHEIIKMFSETYEVIPHDASILDITDYALTESIISIIRPNIFINCAAYTNVDDAEDIGAKTNMDVNAIGVYNLAKVSAKYNIDYITISSDYVFDGKNQEGYREDHVKNPLNAYGMAKYIGEQLALQENPSSIIVRTSWLYGGGAGFKNFINTMLDLGNRLDTLKVVDDQIGNPTNARDLSEALGKVIQNIELYRGSFLHFSNTTSGNGISWYDFASEIFKQTNTSVELLPCASSEFPTKAKRPAYSKLLNTSDIELRGWKDGLKHYLNELK